MKQSEVCGATEPLLYDYLHGLLEPDEALQVQRHLTGCTWCKAELRRWRAFDTTIGGFLTPAEDPVPAGLAQQIVGTLRRETEPEPALFLATLGPTLLWTGALAILPSVVGTGLLEAQFALWTVAGLLMCLAVFEGCEAYFIRRGV